MINRPFKTLAIIPARGNSKRLKNKNLLRLGSDTLLEHSIKYALSNKDIIDKILVTTDSPEIKEVALTHNVDVIDRPKNLALDTSSTIDALVHVLENTDSHFDNIVLLQPTNPLRPADLLRRSFEIFIGNDYKSLFTVSRNERKLGKINAGSFNPYNYKPGQRSQDMESLFYENGLLYIVKPEELKKGRLISKHSFPFVMDHPYGKVDIDVQEDLDLANFIYKKYCS